MADNQQRNPNQGNQGNTGGQQGNKNQPAQGGQQGQRNPNDRDRTRGLDDEQSGRSDRIQRENEDLKR